MKRAICLVVMLLAATLLRVAAASAILNNADACRVAKLKAVGTYMDCRLEEEAKAISNNVPPGFTLCDERLEAAWVKAESAYGAGCPSVGDLDAVMNRIIGDAAVVSDTLDGGSPTLLRRMPASGAQVCYEGVEYLPIPCAGTGQDAEFRAGVARTEEFKDNGDGTISDVVTGLMWEKKAAFDGVPDAANLHDVDNLYPWSGQCSQTPTSFCYVDAECVIPGVPSDTCVIYDGQGGTVTAVEWVAKLNEGSGFAGYKDWRLPNMRELETLLCFGSCYPATPPAFHSPACAAGCTDVTDPTCSCTPLTVLHWSSTMHHVWRPSMWTISFGDPLMLIVHPHYGLALRAVRGGL